LNLAFVTKIFNPESTFYNKLGQIWELQAELDELLSLMVPEAAKSKNPLLVDFAEKISKTSTEIKVSNNNMLG